MLPTIEEHNSFIIVDYFSHKVLRHSFKVGDVVTANSPGHFYRPVCKRVCGVEGDEVRYKEPHSGLEKRLIIPAGHYWLLGDNPGQSTDSRHYGAVSRGRVKGRVVWKFWPWGRIN